jgi:hypothetical protein
VRISALLRDIEVTEKDERLFRIADKRSQHPGHLCSDECEDQHPDVEDKPGLRAEHRRRPVLRRARRRPGRRGLGRPCTGRIVADRNFVHCLRADQTQPVQCLQQEAKSEDTGHGKDRHIEKQNEAVAGCRNGEECHDRPKRSQHGEEHRKRRDEQPQHRHHRQAGADQRAEHIERRKRDYQC